MSSHWLSMIGWSFAPDIATRTLLSIWYGITIRAGDPRPQPGSPKYKDHYRRVKICIVSLYLLFTIYEADWEIRKASDYYQDLGVSHYADERAIKSRFRKLAQQFHPDKNKSSPEKFVHLKLAQDTLLNPVKRFAYDRFGPSIHQCQRCASIGDYVTHGFWPMAAGYLGAGSVMYVVGIMGYLPEMGKFWRWFVSVSLFVFETYAITRPYFPGLSTKFINPILSTLTNHPPYLPFQLIILLRKVGLTLYIAFTQIGPLLQSPDRQAKGADPELILREQLNRLTYSATAIRQEATSMYQLAMVPFQSNPDSLREVKTKVQNWAFNNTVREERVVKDAAGRVIQRRRIGAPAGAVGNR